VHTHTLYLLLTTNDCSPLKGCHLISFLTHNTAFLFTMLPQNLALFFHCFSYVYLNSYTNLPNYFSPFLCSRYDWLFSHVLFLSFYIRRLHLQTVLSISGSLYISAIHAPYSRLLTREGGASSLFCTLATPLNFQIPKIKLVTAAVSYLFVGSNCTKCYVR
jgi:hypothetical protein